MWPFRSRKKGDDYRRGYEAGVKAATPTHETINAAFKLGREAERAESTQPPVTALEQAIEVNRAFKRWAETQGGYHFERSSMYGRTYSSENTEHAWRGWANAIGAASRPTKEHAPDRPRHIQMSGICMPGCPACSAKGEAHE